MVNPMIETNRLLNNANNGLKTFRSGAFKIITGGQLPMAYQVTLHKNSVSWRYPHPRAITRLIAFPLPGRVRS